MARMATILEKKWWSSGGLDPSSSKHKSGQLQETARRSHRVDRAVDYY